MFSICRSISCWWSPNDDSNCYVRVYKFWFIIYFIQLYS